MMNEIFFLSGISFLSALQFLECWGYLRISQKIGEPLSPKGQISVRLMWLSMAALICINGVVGINLVKHSEVDLNKAIGVLPIVIGIAFSFIIFRSDWKDFYKRFQKKN